MLVLRRCYYHRSAYIRVPVVGIEIDRDVNATRNILRLAQAMSSVGVSARELVRLAVSGYGKALSRELRVL